MKRKVSLIFNPVAGQGNPEVDLEAISSLLDSEIDLDVVITTAECKPGDLIKAAIYRGAEAIIAARGRWYPLRCGGGVDEYQYPAWHHFAWYCQRLCQCPRSTDHDS